MGFKGSLPIYIAVVAAAACGADRIHRTDLRSWKALELKTEAIALDVPSDAFNLQMHSRSNGIADADWFISIGIERKSDEEAAHPLLPSADNPLSSDADYMKWLTWLNSYHGTLSVYELQDQSRQYRRDVRLANGDITSIQATYRYAAFSETERAADDAAIRRILNSAKPID